MSTHAVTPVDAQLVTFQTLRVRYRPSAVFLCVLAGDLLAITIARLPIEWPHIAKRTAGWQSALVLPVLTFVSVLAFAGLYRRRARVNTAMGLKNVTFAVSFYFLWNEMAPALHDRALLPPVALLLTSWCLSIFLVLLFRSLGRQLFSSKSWWFIPTIVFYTGNETLHLMNYLRQHTKCDIKPIAVLVPDDKLSLPFGVPAFPYRLARVLREEFGVTRAIVIHSDHGSQGALEAIEPFENIFPHLIILNGLEQFYTLDVSAFEIGHSLAVEVRRKSLSLSAKVAKRTMELLLVLLAAPFIAPIVLFLLVLVRLDSPGPVFFGHTRIGRNGRAFKAWKIRTMKVNSAELLQSLLADADARDEWERDRKLRYDPRITRIGKWLRRSSLDELPQLWNVLRGEMSIVGPRPIVQEEAVMYGQRFPLYCRVTPGITGLWQVSGRSATTMSERVRLDSYYVRNWSPWLDIDILLRTAQAVLQGRGAY